MIIHDYKKSVHASEAEIMTTEEGEKDGMGLAEELERDTGRQ